MLVEEEGGGKILEVRLGRIVTRRIWFKFNKTTKGMPQACRRGFNVSVDSVSLTQLGLLQ